MSSSSHFFFLIPAMYFLFFIAMTAAAVADRRMVAARWAAAGFIIAGISIIVDGYREPGNNSWPSWFTIVTHWIPLFAITQAFRARHGLPPVRAAIVAILAVAVIMAPEAPWRPAAEWRGFIIQGTCAFVIAAALPSLWRRRRRALVDALAFGVVLGAAVSYAGRAVVMLFRPLGDTRQSSVEFFHGLNVVFHGASALLALVAGIMLLLAIGYDALRLRTLESRTDALTGLGNRRLLGEMIDRDMKGEWKVGAAIVIDLDHFKRVNDTYGHEAGDVLLRAVGRQLREMFEGYGTVFRTGGEEFLLLVEEQHAAAAPLLALSARSAVSTLSFAKPLEEVVATASVGMSKRLRDQSVETAIRHADDAVYSAKRAGRDRVIQAVEVGEAVEMEALS